ncbi:MAG: hypothetical protein SGBAC_009741 [Bacillariaceae sp.]
MERNAEQELKKLVWVTVGKTEHQAWLLESVKDKNVVSIRWETTGSEEKVPVMSIRHEAPDDGRRSRRKRTTVQASLKDLDGAGIQMPRKQKRRQTKTKATTKTKKETVQTESVDGGQVEPLGAKVESKRLAAGTLSALSDQQRLREKGIQEKGKCRLVTLQKHHHRFEQKQKNVQYLTYRRM